MRTNDGILNLGWDIVHLIKRLGRIRLSHSFSEREESFSEVIAGFFGHLSRQVINTMKQNAVLVVVVNFIDELILDAVI